MRNNTNLNKDDNFYPNPELEEIDIPNTKNKSDILREFENSVYTALETYSNVHRGSGHNSLVTTCLFEKAREIVLEYLKLSKRKYLVIFCSPMRAKLLTDQMKAKDYQCLSSLDFGIQIGIRALVVRKKALSKNLLFQPGGGAARLVASNWVVWSKSPDKFEAGTPAIINIIAFAKILLLCRRYGKELVCNSFSLNYKISEIFNRDELNDLSGEKLLSGLQNLLIGKNMVVPTVNGSKRFINLDNAASTPSFIPVWEVICKTWRISEQTKNEVVNHVKSVCSGFLDAPLSDYELIFTSNTTESINLLAESMTNSVDSEIHNLILSTLLEHTSNDLPWRMIPGLSQIRMAVDSNGFLNIVELEKLLDAYNRKKIYGKKRIKLVSISGASNVLGTCNNLAEISRIVHGYDAQILVDAAQLVAHRKVEMKKWNIDYLVFSAHKVYAPFGTGVLIAKRELYKVNSNKLSTIIASGEENIVGIAALGKALTLIQQIGIEFIQKKEMELTKKLLEALINIPEIKLFGIQDTNSSMFEKRVGVFVFRVKGIFAGKVAQKLAEHGGIGIRSGCHCAHILIKHLLSIPPFLEKFQKFMVRVFPQIKLPGLSRVSIGIQNTQKDIDELLKVLKNLNKNFTSSDEQKKKMHEFMNQAIRNVFDC